MSIIADFVTRIKAGFQDLSPDEIVVSQNALRPWLARVAETRRRYDEGLITDEERAKLPPGSQRRAAGYHLTPMTEEETGVAWRLYQQYAAYIAGMTADAYQSVRTTMGLDDALADSWEVYMACLSAYDPDRASLSTWLGQDYYTKIRHAIQTSTSSEDELPDDYDIEDMDGDVEEYLDLAAWAERFTATDPTLQEMWEVLSGAEPAVPVQ